MRFMQAFHVSSAFAPALMRYACQHMHRYQGRARVERRRHAHAAVGDQRGRSRDTATGAPLVITHASKRLLLRVVGTRESIQVVAVEKVGAIAEGHLEKVPRRRLCQFRAFQVTQLLFVTQSYRLGRRALAVIEDGRCLVQALRSLPDFGP